MKVNNKTGSGTVSGKAYGKINLSLDVIGRRSDGYHLVRMIMQTVDIFDMVTVKKLSHEVENHSERAYIPSSNDTGCAAGENDIPNDYCVNPDPSGITILTDTGEIPSGPSNLAWKAADVMRRNFGISDSLVIRIEKKIPIAAGMAGGSADAAAVFRLIRKLYGIDVPDKELQKLALPLGADIPYCITGGTQLSEGIGEVLTELPTPPSCTLLVVKPDIDVSTAWVYEAFDSIPEKQIRHPDVDGMIQAIRENNLLRMSALCGNVLEQKTGTEYPIIGELKNFFMDHGALTSIMTGSGPTVFAIYEDEKTAEEAFAILQSIPDYENFLKFKTVFI